VIPARGRGLFSNRRYHVEDKTFVVPVNAVDTAAGVRGFERGHSSGHRNSHSIPPRDRV